MLSSLWNWLKSYFSTPNQGSATDRTQSTVAIDTLPGSSIAGAITSVADVTKVIVSDLNMPQMVQGRLNAQEQAEKDRIVKDANEAIRTGDTNEVSKDLS